MKFLSEIPVYIWLIIFGVIWVVILIRLATFYFSEENQKRIVKNIVKKYFGFLFEHGFSVDESYANGPNGAWAVVLKSEICKISIVQDRGYIDCELAPPRVDRRKYLDLPSIIAKIEDKQTSLYYPKSSNIYHQLDFYSKLFDLHYEEIIAFMKDSSRYFATVYQQT